MLIGIAISMGCVGGRIALLPSREGSRLAGVFVVGGGLYTVGNLGCLIIHSLGEGICRDMRCVRKEPVRILTEGIIPSHLTPFCELPK